MDAHSSRVMFSKFESGIETVAVHVTTERHSLTSGTQFRSEAKVRDIYRIACGMSRLISQGYSHQDARTIAGVMVLKIDWSAMIHNNSARLVVERFLRAKLAERRTRELAAQRKALRALIQEWTCYDLPQPSVEEAAQYALNLPLSYVDGCGSNPAVYRKLIARVQDAVDRREAQADYESEAGLCKAESGYYAEAADELRVPYSLAEESYFAWQDFHRAEFADQPPTRVDDLPF